MKSGREHDRSTRARLGERLQLRHSTCLFSLSKGDKHNLGVLKLRSSLAGSSIVPSKHYDITVGDIINEADAGLFSLLKYSFNLTPAIRDELSKDLSSMLTELEPQLPDANQSTLRAGSIEHKKTFVMKPSPQMRFNPPT